MRIALFDYKIIATNPIGYAHLSMLNALCREHDFTVFAAVFENPHPGRIRWVRIPVPTRPLALMFLAFHALAPYHYWLHCQATAASFDLVQIGECNLAFGDLAHVQFCHRFYLRHHWRHSHAGGMRGCLRWLDHWLHALVEPRVYRRVRDIVLPSNGLARELQTEYPYTRTKTHVLPNPVDLERMRQPEGFDREEMRRQMGIANADFALVFIALGHFERKGLPLLLEALFAMGNPGIKLLVVGGEPDLVSAYRELVRRMGLDNRVIFAGLQRCVAPYLWAADAFVLPSFYETFSLVTFEAAAAGLAPIVTPVSGVADFIKDGENGILIEPTLPGVIQGIRRFLELSAENRQRMGQRAKQTATQFGLQQFALRWQGRYREMSPTGC